MNNNTREDLKAFVSAVENLAHAVSSHTGPEVFQRIYDTSEQLKLQLDHDETILP